MEVVFYMSHLAKVLVGLIALAMVSMPVSAEEAGLSGECYNEDGTEGGQGRVNVSATEQDLVTADEVISIANALAHFATQSVNDGSTGNACKQADTEDGVDRDDYLEVHAGPVQVCYKGTLLVDGSCPTAPSGPA